jgi:hypothetical protein
MHLRGSVDDDAHEPSADDEDLTDFEPVDTADETRFSHDPTMLGQVRGVDNTSSVQYPATTSRAMVYVYS